MLVEGLQMSVLAKPTTTTTTTTTTVATASKSFTGPSLALAVAQSWVTSAFAAYKKTGFMFEKYDATQVKGQKGLVGNGV
jgi:hypothetical protein